MTCIYNELASVFIEILLNIGSHMSVSFQIPLSSNGIELDHEFIDKIYDQVKKGGTTIVVGFRDPTFGNIKEKICTISESYDNKLSIEISKFHETSKTSKTSKASKVSEASDNHEQAFELIEMKSTQSITSEFLKQELHVSTNTKSTSIPTIDEQCRILEYKLSAKLKGIRELRNQVLCGVAVLPKSSNGGKTYVVATRYA